MKQYIVIITMLEAIPELNVKYKIIESVPCRKSLLFIQKPYCWVFFFVFWGFFCLVWGLSSHSRIFHSYGDLTITGEGWRI